MILLKRILPAAGAVLTVLTAVSALTGCGLLTEISVPAADPSQTSFSLTSATETTTTEATTTTTTESTTVTTTTTVTAVKPVARTLTDADKAFLKDYVFVGDSICFGLGSYGILPKEQVVAKASVAARSIFDYTFTVGGQERNAVEALAYLQPKNVIFSMGMNDVNMTSKEKYCENYADLLAKAQEAVPDAKLYVASITPLTASTKFCKNSRIDEFNAAIKQYLAENAPYWGYVDIATVLKGDDNNMLKKYTSGDGIHISPAAYNALLGSLCDQLNPGGTAAVTSTTVTTAVTSSVTSASS